MYTHPADVLAPGSGGEGLGARDGAAARDRRGVSPASAPLLGPHRDWLRERALRVCRLVHLPRHSALQISFDLPGQTTMPFRQCLPSVGRLDIPFFIGWPQISDPFHAVF